jgi:hypothetical protein
VKVHKSHRIPFDVEMAVRQSIYGRPGATCLDMPDDIIRGAVDDEKVAAAATHAGDAGGCQGGVAGAGTGGATAGHCRPGELTSSTTPPAQAAGARLAHDMRNM